MKVSWNTKPENVGKDIIKELKAVAPKVLDAFSEEVQKTAQRNFNKAVIDISGDNPYVWVERTISGNTAKISCLGEQVLFAEFGAGIMNSFTEKDVYIPEHTVSTSSGATYTVKGHTKTLLLSAKGFKGGGLESKLPIPAGIVPLGQYGKGHGKDDYWIRPTRNGRQSSRESNVHTRDGGIRTDVVWTEGTRPIRGLWRARQTALNKLNNRRLKIK